MAKERIIIKDDRDHIFDHTYEWDRKTGELRERDAIGCTHSTGHYAGTRDEAVRLAIRDMHEKCSGKVERVEIYDENRKLIRSERYK